MKTKKEGLKEHFQVAAIEPKMVNRYSIYPKGIDIPEWAFQNYEFYNEGEKLIFTTEIIEVLNRIINPKELFDITGFDIKTLDPTGTTVHEISFDISEMNFFQKNAYKKDGISKFKLKCSVNIKTCTDTYLNLVKLEKNK